jgi:hypothetical protein
MTSPREEVFMMSIRFDAVTINCLDNFVNNFTHFTPRAINCLE